MTDQELEARFTRLVANERKITHEIIRHINFIEDRKIHLKRGCSRMFDYLMRRHGYSETAARERIDAARLLRAVPEVAEKIQNNEINLSTAAKAQKVIRKSEKITGKKLSPQQKSEVVKKIENKTLNQTERTLFELFPEVAEAKQESIKRTGVDKHRLSMDIDEKLLENIKRIAELNSHKNPNASTAELWLEVSEDYLNRHDPLRKPKPKNSDSELLTETKIRQTKQRDEDSCQWIDPVTKEKCGSKFFVQTDHIRGQAKGGSNRPENLRCLCQAHNLLHSELTYGKRKANEWRGFGRGPTESRRQPGGAPTTIVDA